jgi:outer membrane protein TolC
MTHNQEIQTVIQTVMDDTYNYLYQLALLQSDKANLENAQVSLDAANTRFALGLAALGDVAQSRTQYLQSKITLTTQKQNVEDAFAQLAVDLGLPANIPFKVQPLPEQIVANPILESVDQLVERAQLQRQDFMAAQANVKAKEALLLHAKRAVYPALNTSLDIGYYWFNANQQEKNAHWSLELNLTFPIFQGFYYKNGVRNAESNLKISQAQMLQTELEVIQSVTTAHMGVKTAAQNLADAEEYLQAAELEFNIALTGYKAGTMTLLDVISAQSSLADARAKKANSQKNWFVSLAAIAYATGSLCASPNEEAISP